MYRCAKLTTTQTGTASQMHARQTIAVVPDSIHTYRKTAYAPSSLFIATAGVCSDRLLWHSTRASYVLVAWIGALPSMHSHSTEICPFWRHSTPSWSCPVRGSAYAYRRLAQKICDTVLSAYHCCVLKQEALESGPSALAFQQQGSLAVRRMLGDDQLRIDVPPAWFLAYKNTLSRLLLHREEHANFASAAEERVCGSSVA